MSQEQSGSIAGRYHRFVRSKDGAIFGVCAGLARGLGIDVVLMRVIWVASFLCFFTGPFIYLLLAIALPREDKISEAYESRVLGVCARAAQRWDIEVGVVRSAFLLLTLLSAFIGGLCLYFGAHFLLPQKESHQYN